MNQVETIHGGYFKTSGLVFNTYLLFMISYLLHLPARFSVLGAIRFDMLLAGFLLLAFAVNFANYKRATSHPISKALFLIFGYILVSLPVVEWPGSVLKANLVPFIKGVVFFFFTLAYVDTEKRLRLTVLVFVACQSIRVLEPLYMNITSGYWGSGTYIGGGHMANRLSGAPSDVVNPNGLAFVICIVWAYWHYLVGESSKMWHKLLYWLMIPILGYAMILTMSRSGFVGLLVIALIIFLQSKRKLLLIVLATAAVSVAIANMTDIQRDRYLSLTGSETATGSGTASGRVRFMGRMYETWLNRPIFGHGLGTSKEAGANTGSDAKIAHSLYLEVLIELGLIGFIIYLVFLKRVFNALKEMTDLASTLGQHSAEILEKLHFEIQLVQAIKTCAWMFLIFSIAYFGLSRSWWYFLAGLTVVLSLHIEQKLKRLQEKES